MDRNEKIKAYAAWGCVSFFWGTTYLAIRIGVETLPPALFAGIRFLIAGLIFMFFLRVRGYALPKRNELLDNAVVSIALLVVANGTVVWAEQWVPSSLAALIVATLPFWMVGINAVLPRGDKLAAKKVFGILIGFSGLILLLWRDIRSSVDPAYLRGILVLFIAPIAWGAGSIYSKNREIETRPLMAAAFQMAVAGVVLVLIGAVLGEFTRLTLHPRGWLALVYLAVFGSIVGYSSYIYSLAKLPAAFVSTYAYINPIIAVILGWLLLDERLSVTTALATGVILLGVVLVKTEYSKDRAQVTVVSKEKEVQSRKAGELI